MVLCVKFLNNAEHRAVSLREDCDSWFLRLRYAIINTEEWMLGPQPQHPELFQWSRNSAVTTLTRLKKNFYCHFCIVLRWMWLICPKIHPSIFCPYPKFKSFMLLVISLLLAWVIQLSATIQLVALFEICFPCKIILRSALQQLHLQYGRPTVFLLQLTMGFVHRLSALNLQKVDFLKHSQNGTIYILRHFHFSWTTHSIQSFSDKQQIRALTSSGGDGPDPQL